MLKQVQHDGINEPADRSSG